MIQPFLHKNRKNYEKNYPNSSKIYQTRPVENFQRLLKKKLCVSIFHRRDGGSPAAGNSRMVISELQLSHQLYAFRTKYFDIPHLKNEMWSIKPAILQRVPWGQHRGTLANLAVPLCLWGVTTFKYETEWRKGYALLHMSFA